MYLLDDKVKSKIVAWMFIIPGLLAFTLFKYYPILLGFVVSFFKYDIVNPPGVFIGLQNYIEAIGDTTFRIALLHNLQFFCISLLINFWVPIVLALLVNELRKGKTFFRMVYFLPAVAPGICIAILFRYLWQPDYGFANQIMMFLNLPEQMWLNDDMMVKWCIKAQGFILGGGMSMLIYLAALKEIPMELFEAAYMDGASFLQRVRYIVFPSISSVIKVLFIMQMIADLNSFDEVLTMTGGGPAGATETMILYAYNTAVQKMDYSYSAAMANIVMILALGITAFHTYASSKKS